MTDWQSPEELADELGIPVGTIYQWRYRGRGPKGHKIGKHIRYRRSDVEAWLETRADAPRPASINTQPEEQYR